MFNIKHVCPDAPILINNISNTYTAWRHVIYAHVKKSLIIIVIIIGIRTSNGSKKIAQCFPSGIMQFLNQKRSKHFVCTRNP